MCCLVGLSAAMPQYGNRGSNQRRGNCGVVNDVELVEKLENVCEDTYE